MKEFFDHYSLIPYNSFLNKTLNQCSVYKRGERQQDFGSVYKYMWSLYILNVSRKTHWEAFIITFKTWIIKNTTLLSKGTNNLFVLCTRQIWKQNTVNNRAIKEPNNRARTKILTFLKNNEFQLVVVSYTWNSSQNKFKFFAIENTTLNILLWNVKQLKNYGEFSNPFWWLRCTIA